MNGTSPERLSSLPGRERSDLCIVCCKIASASTLRVFDEEDSLGMFLFFPSIKLRNGTVVTHHPRPDFTGLAFAIFELDCCIHRFQAAWLGVDCFLAKIS